MQLAQKSEEKIPVRVKQGMYFMQNFVPSFRTWIPDSDIDREKTDILLLLNTILDTRPHDVQIRDKIYYGLAIPGPLSISAWESYRKKLEEEWKRVLFKKI